MKRIPTVPPPLTLLSVLLLLAPISLVLAEEASYLRLTAGNDAALRMELAAKPFQADAGSPRQTAARLAAGARHTAQLGAFTVSVSDFDVTVEHPQQGGARRFTWDGRLNALYFDCGSAPIYGLGQGGPQGDRRGHLHPMTNGMGAFHMEEFGARVPIPLLVSPEGWAVFVARPHGPIDLRGPRAGLLSGKSEVGCDLHWMVSREPLVLYENYAAITGRPPLPPIWALGYQQSHRTLAPGEALEVAREFRRRRLPCDVLIYLGTGYCPSGWNRGNGSFEFNEEKFPQDTIVTLQNLNFRVALHVTKAPRDLEHIEESYWQAHKPLFKTGLDGFWADDGDELPPGAKLARHRMYYERALAERPGVRPYTLHRNTVAGAQAFGGGWLWSGDIYSKWESLRNSVRVGINTSASGLPYWGTDTGGFWPTVELTGELYVRWFQFSSFTPLFRSHGRTWHTRLPWGWNTGQTGPVETETRRQGVSAPTLEELRNEAVEPICRRYLELRYRLLPYTYSLCYATTTYGAPLMRGLWMHYPDDPQAVAEVDEYLWGRDILVAPVTAKGVATRACYLPFGLWHDFWSGAKHDGGRVVDRTVDVATMPLFVRAGAIIPMGPVRQFATEKTEEPARLQVYAGGDGEFIYYHDDGVNFPPRVEGRFVLKLAWADADRRLTITPQEGDWSMERHPLTVTVHDGPERTLPHTVVVKKPDRTKIPMPTTNRKETP
jgi:alpha-glucosidase (family GH31 glycosyl hydrolase)